MYCPVCRSEYRPGFTRCATCAVDLVEELSAEPPTHPSTPRPDATVAVSLLDYCGFLDLDEARRAREQLRTAGVRSEIAIRDEPVTSPSQPPREEYWLRVASCDRKTAYQILGYERVEDESRQKVETFACSDCGHSVEAEEALCPGCGARFD